MTMTFAIRKIGWACVAVLTFLTALVVAPFAPASVSQAQQVFNLAAGQPATQSSTGFGGDAARAVDGVTDGVYNNGSVTHTNSDVNAWWQVDLGSVNTIDSTTLFNRTDCCQNRLSDFYIFASDTDLTGRTFADIVADAGVQRVQVPGQVGNSLTVTDSLVGRFVRIQLAGTGIVSLAEVQLNQDIVGATPLVPGDQWNRVGEELNLSVTWPASADVVGLPAGLVLANGVITGSVPVKGRWPVEVRYTNGSIDYFQWLITDGAPGGVASEHLPVDPTEVSPRPSEGMDGVVWDRFNNDTTASLDVTVWDMQQVGDYMYVGGEFKEVIEQDTGQTTNQAHLARFSVDTGKWDPTFRPVLDGNVHALEINSRGLLLVGGEFTNIDGQPNTEGLAALDPNSGQVDPSFAAWVERPWYPQGRAIVRELEVVGSYLYVGGNFSHVNGPGGTRARVHKATRVTADYGTIDPTWLPVISGGSVWGIGVDQDRGRVHLSGRFTSANGSTAFNEYVTVTTETGATVEGLTPRPINSSRQTDVYDVEYAADRVWLAGSQHQFVGLNADTHNLDFWQFTGNNCTTVYCWSGAGVGGDFQFTEKIGEYIYAGCHCNDRFNNRGQPNHYSSVTNQRTTHSVTIAYSLDGAPVETVFDIGGNIDGGWSVATDDTGCIWLGGDIVDGGFYEPGGRVFARGFARFCGDSPVPAQPQGLTAISADVDGVELQWNAVADATGYRISRDGVEVGVVDSGAFTSWSGGNVVLGRSYEYEVRATNRAGVLSEPAAITVVIGFLDTEPPTVPTNVTAIDAGNGSVQVSWEASVDNAGVASYLVYRDGAYVGFAAGDVTMYSEVPPSEGITYVYTVRAVDINEFRSELSDPGATVIVGGEDTEPPAAPTNVVAIDVGDGDNSVQITWDAAVDNVGIRSYLLYRDGAYLAWTQGGVTNYTDVPPAEGVAYLYEVRAVDLSDNRSEKSDPGAIVTVGGDDVEAPTVPANVAALDVGDGSVQISWDASVDNIAIQSYLIYRDGAYAGWTPAGTTTFTQVPPAEGVAYVYTVRAVDVNDNRSEISDPGATVVVGGLDDEAPTVPTNITAIDAGDGSVQITWDASTDNVGIQSYLVYRDGAYLAWTPDGVTTLSDVPPAEGVEYVYTVRAVDVNENRSEPTDPGAAVTVGGPDAEPPSVPVNVGLINPAAGATEIIWDPSIDNVGIQSYLVYRDGAYLAWTPGDVTTFVDTTSVAGETYDYEIRAVDTNDNRSDKSTPFTVAIQ